MRIFFIFQLLILLIISISSCSGEFSKYEKKWKNDIEKMELRGKVKEYIFYTDSTKEVSRFNKYGFIKEKFYYSDNKLNRQYIYEYNEYGNLKIKRVKNESKKYEIIIKYDKHQNRTEKIENTLEIYDTNSDEKIGMKVLNTYENKYDSSGKIISIKRLNPNGECQSLRIFNEDEILIKETKFDKNGKAYHIEEYTCGEGKYSECRIREPNNLFIKISFSDDGLSSQLHSYSKNTWIDEEYTYREFNKEGYLIREFNKYIHKQNYNSATEFLYTRNKYGNATKIIKKSYHVFYTDPQIEEHNNIYRYDSEGNIIYFCNQYGNEESSEYTYY